MIGDTSCLLIGITICNGRGHFGARANFVTHPRRPGFAKGILLSCLKCHLQEACWGRKCRLIGQLAAVSAYLCSPATRRLLQTESEESQHTPRKESVRVHVVRSCQVVVPCAVLLCTLKLPFDLNLCRPRAVALLVQTAGQDIGLLGIRQQERLLFYRVCPFGATFSSHWFARLGGFFTRCLHLLIWLSHVLLLYVDDLLLFQNSKVLPLSAALTLAFCACFNIPLSWKKLQMGQTITWIGWEINLSAACFSLPEAKRNKLYELVSECLRHRQVSRKQLDKLLGLLQFTVDTSRYAHFKALAFFFVRRYAQTPWYQCECQSHFLGGHRLPS